MPCLAWTELSGESAPSVQYQKTVAVNRARFKMSSPLG